MNRNFVCCASAVALSLGLISCSSGTDENDSNSVDARSADAVSQLILAEGLIRRVQALPAASIAERRPALMLEESSLRARSGAELDLAFGVDVDPDSAPHLLALQLSGSDLRLDFPVASAGSGQTLRLQFDSAIAAEAFCGDMVALDSFGRASDPQRLCIRLVGDGAPIANAGPSRIVLGGSRAILDAGGSAGEDVLGFEWLQTAGPAVELSDPGAIAPEFTAPAEGAESLVFEVKVTDAAGRSAFDRVQVGVVSDTPENRRPTAFAGPAREVDEGVVVRLVGDGGDRDGSVTGFVWSQVSGPAVELQDANTRIARFTAPDVSARQPLEFELGVSDDSGATGVARTVVIVRDLDSPPPIANAGPPQNIPEGLRVQLDGRGSTGQEPLSYSWRQLSGISVILENPDSSRPAFDAPLVDKDETLVFELTVTGSGGQQDVDEVTVVITNDRFSRCEESDPDCPVNR